MKAIGYSKSLPISDPDSLRDIDLPEPVPGPRDLLVAVEAVSVNPVDTKVRMRMQPEPGDPHAVLGWDASGIVQAVGSEVSLFKPGDAVFYAGAIQRPGTNAELHLVDERIVGRKPTSLDHSAAAALPLTSITAWELLFDGMHVPEQGGAGEVLLIIGGAGGVGSILTQLAKQLTKLTVVVTASRPETVEWCRKMSADYIIDHRQPLADQITALGLPAPRYVASLTASDKHFTALVDLIAPRGVIALIDDPGPLDVTVLKPKALTLHWEFMFALPATESDAMLSQHRLLNRVADLVDSGHLVSTLNRDGGRISAETLKAAHAHQESGTAIGKTVLTGL